MNDPKRDPTRMYNHQDYQAAKRPRIVRPKIRKPITPYVELGQFDLEYEQLQNRYCYDWFRRSGYEQGRPFCFQHEQFHLKHQQGPRMVYLDSFAEGRNSSLYQVAPSSSTHPQPTELNCKTKIFNPIANGGYTRSTGSNKIHDRMLDGDELRHGYGMLKCQAEYFDKNGFYDNKHETRPKSVDKLRCKSKKRAREGKDGATHRKRDEYFRREESKEKNLSYERKIDKEKRMPLFACSTESRAEEEKKRTREEENEVTKAEINTGEERMWRKEKKLRRKAFTVASSLVESINETPEEKVEAGDLQTLRGEIEKHKETRTGENAACRVFGLLSLQGSRERRYEITVEELRRRVSAPEHLNKVDMISYLRLAKNSARLLLEKYDIINSLHHRLSKHTILSKVSEKECEDLAAGIHDINMSYFPFQIVAQHSLGRIEAAEANVVKDNLRKRYQDIATTRSVLKEMCGTLDSMYKTKEMVDFKNITHTFGIQNISNHAQFLDKYFKEEEQLILETLKKN